MNSNENPTFTIRAGDGGKGGDAIGPNSRGGKGGKGSSIFIHGKTTPGSWTGTGGTPGQDGTGPGGGKGGEAGSIHLISLEN